MSFRATRATRVFVAAALAWLGLALCAQAAHATHGRVQIVKINQGGNPNDSFAFHPTLTQSPGAVPAATDFSLQGGQSSPAWDTACTTDRPTHQDHCKTEWPNPTLKVTEQPTAGYTLSDITCRYTQGQDDNNLYAGQPTTASPVKPAGEVTTDLASGTVTFNVLHYNEWVVCWYTNTPTPPGTSAGAPPPGTAPARQPQIEVSPAQARPGSATLRGPKGCPTSNVVAATVSGKRIVKVTFYVDNRKVKTLTKPNKGKRWSLSVAMRKVAYGTHRVYAKVEFARSSGTRAKTLRLAFTRCGASNARPQFTG
ncbi:MAG TPA: hypothetical protein VF257_15520 [Solirubrobacteraceae bacterium]